VSEYYCSSFGYRGDDREKPEVLNKWLADILTLLEEKRWTQGHMLPQNYYVYDENGNMLLTHVLKYQNSQPEFDAQVNVTAIKLALTYEVQHLTSRH
jgi:hypothetical protein